MIHLFTAPESADALLTPEHGAIAAISVVLARLLDLVQSYFRNKKRKGSLEGAIKEQVPDIVREEFSKLWNQRATQEIRWQDKVDTQMQMLSEEMRDQSVSQVKVSSQVEGVNRQLEAMRMGIFRLVAAIKPELVATLDIGGPVG